MYDMTKRRDTEGVFRLTPLPVESHAVGQSEAIGQIL
jgi:hypothetical protein